MTNTWLIADPHFGHAGVCRFMREDGSKLRPWDNSDEMDEAMIDRWNGVVDDRDRVYVLGDLTFTKRNLDRVMPRLKGRKVLIKGNHDTLKLSAYLPYFDDIRACHVFDGSVLTHIPIHPDSVERYKSNIHGHLHSGRVWKPSPPPLRSMTPDPRYFCVSVEHTDYTPISYEVVKKRLAQQLGEKV